MLEQSPPTLTGAFGTEVHRGNRRLHGKDGFGFAEFLEINQGLFSNVVMKMEVRCMMGAGCYSLQKAPSLWFCC